MVPFLQLFHYAATCGAAKFLTTGIYDGIPCDANGGVAPTGIADIFIVVGNIVRILIELAGVLSVIFIIVGGIFYVVSAGDPAQIKRAKGIITQAVIGLVVILLSYAAVTYISGQF